MLSGKWPEESWEELDRQFCILELICVNLFQLPPNLQKIYESDNLPKERRSVSFYLHWLYTFLKLYNLLKSPKRQCSISLSEQAGLCWTIQVLNSWWPVTGATNKKLCGSIKCKPLKTWVSFFFLTWGSAHRTAEFFPWHFSNFDLTISINPLK